MDSIRGTFPGFGNGASSRGVVCGVRLAVYQRLIVLVFATNLGVLAFHGTTLSAAASSMLVNLAAAVLIRQQHVLNVLFGLAGRGSPSWPLWIRWSVSKVHHIGGHPRRRRARRHGVAVRVHRAPRSRGARRDHRPPSR